MSCLSVLFLWCCRSIDSHVTGIEIPSTGMFKSNEGMVIDGVKQGLRGIGIALSLYSREYVVICSNCCVARG